MDTDEFYQNLKESLKRSKDLPGNYIFKFIVLNNNKLLAELQQIFDYSNPVYSTKLSKSNKYISLTVQVFAINEDYVIDFYKQAAKLKDLIML
ncbi:MAG: DUF493 family protein [Solirubrobacteraceae bacterium]